MMIEKLYCAVPCPCEYNANQRNSGNVKSKMGHVYKFQFEALNRPLNKCLRVLLKVCLRI
jgi:hypothetical protein